MGSRTDTAGLRNTAEGKVRAGMKVVILIKYLSAGRSERKVLLEQVKMATDTMYVKTKREKRETRVYSWDSMT